jgi:hypothetical protein
MFRVLYPGEKGYFNFTACFMQKICLFESVSV